MQGTLAEVQGEPLKIVIHVAAVDVCTARQSSRSSNIESTQEIETNLGIQFMSSVENTCITSQ